MKNLYAFLLGCLFALGLMISGMSNPTKVQNFLDIFGNWDPSLAFVMGGAILVAIVPFQYAMRHPQQRTVFQEKIELPARSQIDKKLVIGSSLFGMGWGIAGICPAPSFTLLGLGYQDALYFVIAMFVGVWGHRILIKG